MGQDFNEFDNKRKSFFEKLNKEDINLFLYELGVRLRSYHHNTINEKSLSILKPYVNVYKPFWDVEVWQNVTWGLDDSELDIEEKTVLLDKALEEMNYYDYLVSNAVKFNRPDWSIFGLIGMMQGTLNNNKLEVSNKEDFFDKEDFIRCLKYLPPQFLKKFKEDIIYLFNYFDERGIELFIDLDCHEIFFFEKQVPFDKKKSLHINKEMFSFFDGVKLYENLYSYDNWLSSIDYSVWKNSYVEIDNEKLFIIRDNVKVLSTFRFYDKIELEIIADKFDLIIKEENGVYYAYDPSHNSRQLEISEDNGLVAIYSLDGNSAPESIFIYGVFKSDDLNCL